MTVFEQFMTDLSVGYASGTAVLEQVMWSNKLGYELEDPVCVLLLV